MKQIKYAYNGGLPLSQNVLDWMQTGYKEIFASLGKMGWDGGNPVIMRGCENDGAGVFSAGEIFDGTEIYAFQGGDSVAAGTTKVKLQEYTTSVVFEDGGNQPIYTRKEYVFDATGVDITSLRRWGVTASSTFNFAVAEAAGSIDARVNTVSRLLYLSGSFETIGATGYAATAQKIKLIDDADLEADAVFAPAYPSGPREFLGIVHQASTGNYLDSNNHPIHVIPMRLDNTGIHAYLQKAATVDDYPITVYAVIPID